MYPKTKYNLCNLLYSFAAKDRCLPETLAGNLRAAGVPVLENVSRCAYHNGALVGEYVCPLLVDERAGIFFTDISREDTLMRARLKNLRESLELAGAIMISQTGDVLSEPENF